MRLGEHKPFEFVDDTPLHLMAAAATSFRCSLPGLNPSTSV
jgi:hypothetical protein